jgi:hypothetical protein
MALEHCHDCNATMKVGETACWACGSAVKPKDLPPGLGSRFATAINFFFIISLVFTVASLFTDMAPPFLRCLTVTVVLYLVRSTAGQMMEKEKKKS